jgi:ABC-type oligopeptide transport system ATPase subunit
MTIPMIQANQLCKSFDGKKYSLKNLSLSIQPGEILGLGGESGCGKSTLAKLLVGLDKPTSGSILYKNEDIRLLKHQSRLTWRRQVQMIFQNHSGCLNPRFTLFQTLYEPLMIKASFSKKEVLKEILILLEAVDLSEDLLESYPSELSGGQKQRVAIARALAIDPSFLICDEPFSSLDILTQERILNLLLTIQRKKKLTYLVISHDLEVLSYLSDRLAIMHAGQIVEIGPSRQVYTNPQHPYTQSLVSSVLRL